ncbi:MAG: bifunctional deaminase-reductase domain protein [Segetibacter sp.]|jgi:dihydrofolate reductase|nr:bifunctional deaminase-reductase domain protein [Segetibacter sp.]
MRKVILNVAVTLDGFIEGPNGEYDWCFTDDDYGMNEFLAATDAIFFGRKSYELWAASFSHMWNDKKHYVFSNTLQTLQTNATLINGDIEKKVLEIRNEEGKDIWLFGGASLTTSLLNAGMVDEFLLAIHPVILGSGKALFNGVDKRNWLKLTECKTFDNGLMQNRYSIAR